MNKEEIIKRKLQSLYILKNELTVLNNDLFILREISTSISSPISDKGGMSSSLNKDKISNSVADVIELEDELNKNLKKYNNIRKEITKQIDELKNEKEKMILKYRYLNFFKWEHIAVKLNYEYDYVFKIHKKALINLSKLDGKRQ